jgi:hypothetical protein
MSIHKKKGRILLALLLLCGACKTPAVLTFEKEGNISKLDGAFDFSGFMGPGSITLSTKENFTRLVLVPDADPEEYVVVVEPYYALGDISIPSRAPFNPSTVPTQMHAYVDQLLQAQRSFMRRDYESSEKLISQLEQNYGVTFGSLILAAKIAFIKGDKEKSLSLFKRAKGIYGGSNQLNAYLTE